MYLVVLVGTFVMWLLICSSVLFLFPSVPLCLCSPVPYYSVSPGVFLVHCQVLFLLDCLVGEFCFLFIVLLSLVLSFLLYYIIKTVFRTTYPALCYRMIVHKKIYSKVVGETELWNSESKMNQLLRKMISFTNPLQMFSLKCNQWHFISTVCFRHSTNSK